MLKEHGADTRALEYVKKVRDIHRMSTLAVQPAVAAQSQSGGGGEWTRGFSALGNRVSCSLYDSVRANFFFFFLDRSRID